MTTNRQNTLDIRLPEGVVFSLPLAGPATRFVAWLADCLMAGAIAASLLLIASYFPLPDEIHGFLQIAVYFLVPILYGIVLEGFWRGQTVGKRFLGLRVMDAGGLRLNWRQVFIRNILRAVDAPLPMFYLVGGIVCIFSQRAQRLGDIAADTVVVRTLPAPELDLSQLTAGKYNTLRDHPAIAARLRQRIPPLEAGLALQAILRRNSLEPEARVALFAEIAQRFRAAVPLPEELTEDVTDEQHVRNTVDVLFRARGTQNKA